jgi:aarF domain-containing kinase
MHVVIIAGLLTLNLWCYEKQADSLKIFELSQELLPLLPAISVQLVPEIANRLVSRVVARFLRDVFL